jgi:uridylate kinase
MSRPMVRLVKVGGSLLRPWDGTGQGGTTFGAQAPPVAPELGQRLWAWLQQQAPAVNYLVAGGGELADVIRRADEQHALGEKLSHQLCLRAMQINGEVLRHVIEFARTAPGALPEQQRGIHVLDVVDLLSSAELMARAPTPLPETWQATSDSIAAHLADVLGAQELVLLKSVDLSRSVSYADAQRAGVVDPCFWQMAARIPKVRFINLRDRDFAEWMLFR